MKNIELKTIIIVSIVLGTVFLMSLISVIVGNWHWTGLVDVPKDANTIRGKTLWDLLDLVVVPIALAIGAWYLKKEDVKLEREIEESRAQETALEAYLNYMSDLLIERKLKAQDTDPATKDLAQIRTLTMLRRLSASRKNYLMGFLSDSGLMSIMSLNNANLSGVDLTGLYTKLEPQAWEPVLDQSTFTSFLKDMEANLMPPELGSVNLSNAKLCAADLSNANLSHTDLSGADLSAADLSGAKLNYARMFLAKLNKANLTGAVLFEAKLAGADLSYADLSKANLSNAVLIQANLTNAKVNAKQLKKAKSLKEAILDEELKKQLIDEGLEI